MVKNNNKEPAELSKFISEFLDGYAGLYLTNSLHTLKPCCLAIALYLEYLEDQKGIHFMGFNKKYFEKPMLEGWIRWLKEMQREILFSGYFLILRFFKGHLTNNYKLGAPLLSGSSAVSSFAFSSTWISRSKLFISGSK